MSLPALAWPTPSPTTAFAAAVREGLTTSPKQVPASWLYDDLGSALFESICALPWYQVTRGERHLLEHEVGSLADLDIEFVVELGPGSGEKLAQLVRALASKKMPAVHLVDVSPAALSLAARTLARANVREVTSVCADYREGIATLDRYRKGRGNALVAFLGSNIGNFHWPEAVGLLRGLRARLVRGDRVLLGADLVKPEADLRLAYDDPLGVTAAFNKNLLVRMNRELGAAFELPSFVHRAVWNRSVSRIEMHLVSLYRQRVSIPAAGIAARFSRGESIWTESSYKFEAAQLEALGAAVGLTIDRIWIDEPSRFALVLFRVQ